MSLILSQRGSAWSECSLGTWHGASSAGCLDSSLLCDNVGWIPPSDQEGAKVRILSSYSCLWRDGDVLGMASAALVCSLRGCDET